MIRASEPPIKFRRSAKFLFAADESILLLRSGYLAGQIDFFNLTDAEQNLLRFGLDEVEARTQRELSLAELSLIVQGMPPSGAGMGAIALPATPPTGGMGANGMLPGGSSASRRTKGGM